LTTIRPATAEELADWDEHTVDAPGGHVYQSRAWAEHRVAAGWQADHLVFADDGYRALALRRAFPLVPGASAYVPRGPISAGEDPVRTAERLNDVAGHLAAASVAVVAADAEIRADSSYAERLAELGFHPI
jgi:lipid II:glycine glycyltransferase (peptidoglycan interpeptide bridge formation enzyme)